MRARLLVLGVAAAFWVGGPVPVSQGRPPSGEVILYARSFPAADGSALCVTDPDGSRTAILRTFHGSEIDFPSWSPDGRQVAFERDGQIFVAHPLGGEPELVAPGTHPSWSPDGARVTFESDGEIRTANVDGSDQETLRQGRNPDWSPSVDRIAFDRIPDPYAVDGPEGELKTIDTQGGDMRDVGYGLHAAWSPDGTQIAFAYHSFWGSNIGVVDADGTDKRDLTEPDEHLPRPGFPTWSPDGTEVLFSWGSELWGVNADATNLRRIVRDGGPADWASAIADRPELWTGRACKDPRRSVSLELYGHLSAKGRVRTNDRSFCSLEDVTIDVYKKAGRSLRLAGTSKTDAQGRYSMKLRVHRDEGRAPDRPGRYRAMLSGNDSADCERRESDWETHEH